MVVADCCLPTGVVPVPNWIDGVEQPAATGEVLEKFDPVTGVVQSHFPRSGAADVEQAIAAAVRSQPGWAERTGVERGDILRAAAILLQQRKPEMARLVSEETGKSRKDALGETQAAIEMGFFLAGEGRRFYGRTTTSGVRNRMALTIRQPIGVAALIVAANTPVANVAWKAFPALLCGNSAILKAAEDTPRTAHAFAAILAEAGVPPGVFNVAQGLGEEAGALLVNDSRIPLVSFTGSCAVGRIIQSQAGARLAKVCLELGGKNPLIVCDGAHLPQAVEAAAMSAFSNAGQRCAAGSRIIVFDRVYDEFRAMLHERTSRLRLGNADTDDLGPVINAQQLGQMTSAVQAALDGGAALLIGGHRLTDPAHEDGYFMAPTLLENIGPDDELSHTELFGPIACLYRVGTFGEAVELANRTAFGLTAAVHTRNINRAMTFLGRIRSGVASINGPTYGSEPHMPFGGLGDSGNGFREAGTEVLDVYSEWKTIYINYDPQAA